MEHNTTDIWASIIEKHIEDFDVLDANVRAASKEIFEAGIRFALEKVEEKKKESERLLPFDRNSYVARAAIATCEDLEKELHHSLSEGEEKQ